MWFYQTTVFTAMALKRSLQRTTILKDDLIYDFKYIFSKRTNSNSLSLNQTDQLKTNYFYEALVCALWIIKNWEFLQQSKWFFFVSTFYTACV